MFTTDWDYVHGIYRVSLLANIIYPHYAQTVAQYINYQLSSTPTPIYIALAEEK